VSIILNIKKPQEKDVEVWPRWSFFGIFDGHGGTTCSDYLRDNLHYFVINSKHFPSDPRKALLKGFKRAEDHFLKECALKAEEQRRLHDTDDGSHSEKFNLKFLDCSGSWAIVILFVDNICYVANVGDSRVIMSSEIGDKIYLLSTDHRPTEENETKRIVSNGGKIYQTQTIYNPNDIPKNKRKISKPQVMLGPPRVKPGRLSVSRTFGDIEAKWPVYGGNPKVVIATPEIKQFEISPSNDYLLMGWDGIFDKLTNYQVNKRVWSTVAQNAQISSPHKLVGECVNNVLLDCAANKSLDNITVLVIFFNDIGSEYKKLPIEQKLLLLGDKVCFLKWVHSPLMISRMLWKWEN